MQGKEKIIQVIRRHKRFLVSSHINPEGDSLGSALALRGLLLQLGKQVEVVWDGPVPELYRFLPGSSAIKSRPTRSYEAAFLVDCPVLSRIGRTQRFLSKDKLLCVIDHHISNERFGTVNWVDPNAAAVGEMIYTLFKAFRVKIGKAEAINLYVSLVTDTGSFRYSNTTARVHTLASELIRRGIKPAAIASFLYESHSYPSRRLLALALETLQVDRGGELAWLTVTQKMLRSSRCSSEETEGIVDFARSLKRVRAAVFFREEKNRTIKVSFRSKGNFDVNRIARRFGGGGHRAASGCLVRGSLREVEGKVLSAVRKAL